MKHLGPEITAYLNRRGNESGDISLFPQIPRAGMSLDVLARASFPEGPNPLDGEEAGCHTCKIVVKLIIGSVEGDNSWKAWNRHRHTSDIISETTEPKGKLASLTALQSETVSWRYRTGNRVTVYPTSGPHLSVFVRWGEYRIYSLFGISIHCRT